MLPTPVNDREKHGDLTFDKNQKQSIDQYPIMSSNFQNRNQHFASMCLQAVANSNHLECIDHIFMESGHSQMECDSVHSAIESAVKNRNIYAPSDYYQVVGMTRRSNPYTVQTLSTSDILNYKSLSKHIMRNRAKNTAGENVHWLKIKHL